MSRRVSSPEYRLRHRALEGLHQAYGVFGSLGSTSALDTTLKTMRKRTDREIAHIVKDYKLHSVEQELRAAILKAAEAYWTWRALNFDQMIGLGTRSDIDSLERALRRVVQLLNNGKVRNRLAKVVKTTNPSDLPSPPSSELHYRYSDGIFDSVRHARATISGLLDVTKLACDLDGRNDGSKQRDDLRAAVVPLHRFWRADAKRSGKPSNRGSTYSPAAKFQHACLRLIEPGVTLRLVVDLNS